MKLICTSLVLIFITSYSTAQLNLNFNKTLIECDNNWTVFKSKTPNEFYYGFVYFDKDAGLTYDYSGTFEADETKVTKIIPTENAIKKRLEPSNIKAATMPPELITALKLDVTPTWLAIYQKDSATAKYLYAKGYACNVWGKGNLALTLLENAYKKDPNFEGLTAELAYTYNDLGMYQKAIDILKKEINNQSKSCYQYKEYAYAQIKLNNLKGAITTYEIATKNCNENYMNEEIAYNICFEYYKVKNKELVNYWALQAEKWGKPNDQYLKNIAAFKAELGN